MSTSTVFLIKTIRASNGERLPVLLRGDNGLPVFDAVLWVVSSLRAKGYASATITQALRSIIVLYLVLEREGIDLNERLRTGNFLDPSEIEAISRACNQPLASIQSSFNLDEGGTPQSRVVSREGARMPMTNGTALAEVGPSTTAIRLGYIREFLMWRINAEILRATPKERPNLAALRDLTEQEIRNKAPSATGRSTLHLRMGLNGEATRVLLDVVNPNHPQNPWSNTFARKRNELVIRGFLELGIRRSEFLGVRIRDIGTQGNEISILRRPDDKDDPRLNEPNTKTRDRLLPMSSDLFQIFKPYLLLRRNQPARSNDFLLVANGTGKPLSKSEVNRLFIPLRNVSPLLKNVGPHVLRHTFFENLCEDLDKNRVTGLDMIDILVHLGGWTESSSSPKRYTKRYAQRKANAACRSMQESLRIEHNEQSR